MRMRDRRLELGLSQAVLADQVGVARSWVIRVERGSAGAEMGLVFKALRALRLDLDVRVESTAVPSADHNGEPWTPALSDILDRARRARQ
jgi:HTH-type transcriptional regulator/antitoxin HipB